MKKTLLIIAALLAACSGEPTSCPRLPGGERYCLQNAGGLPFSTLQQTRLQFGTQQMTLLSRVESDSKGLRLLGMTPFGQTVMSVSWENAVLRAELPAALEGKVDPAALLALIQIAYWPADQVRQGLGPQWSLLEEQQRRRLRLANSDEDMLDISWEGSLPYTQLSITAPSVGFKMTARQLDESSEQDEGEAKK